MRGEAPQAQTTHGQYLGVLRALAAWRERTAQVRDQPRGRILKDDAIDELAAEAAGYRRSGPIAFAAQGLRRIEFGSRTSSRLS